MPRPILYALGVFIGTIAHHSFEEKWWGGLVVIIVGSIMVSLLEIIAENVGEKTDDR